MPPNFDKASL